VIRDDGRSEEKIRAELERNPGLAPVVEAFRETPASFEIAAASADLELVPLDPVGGAPNRCRMKLFRPREGRERLCAFFYKKSNLAWSRDRFSYGGVEFKPGEVTDAAARSWIDWLVSGFDPERRPERLKRAFSYDVPE
jgi:hypothetical protein